jgi:hypothetical protein
MQIVEIEVVRLQALQGTFDGAPAVCSRAIGTREFACVEVANHAKRAGKKDALTAIGERLAQQRLIGSTKAIDLSFVESRGAPICYGRGLGIAWVFPC